MTTAKRGRPRLVDQRRSGNTPDEEILDAAAELIAAQGFAKTSTRAIAEAVGIRQGSLYHHFDTKDAILDALLLRTVAKPTSLGRLLLTVAEPATIRLYAMAWFDAHQLLDSKWNLGVLLQLPEARDPKFGRFYDQRESLRACYGELVTTVCQELGNEAGSVSDLTTRLPFYVVETATAIRLDAPQWVGERGPGEVAAGLADAVLRITGYVGDLPGLRARAATLLDAVTPELIESKEPHA